MNSDMESDAEKNRFVDQHMQIKGRQWCTRPKIEREKKRREEKEEEGKRRKEKGRRENGGS